MNVCCVCVPLLCYVSMLFVNGSRYLSYSDTQLLFTRQLSRYVASAATPYSWSFIHLNLDK